MSNKKLNVSELTRLAIEVEFKSAAFSDPIPEQSLMSVVRENLHDWETSLFPLLRIQKKSCYDFLVILLKEAGYSNLTSSNLCAVVCKVRKERSNCG